MKANAENAAKGFVERIDSLLDSMVQTSQAKRRVKIQGAIQELVYQFLALFFVQAIETEDEADED